MNTLTILRILLAFMLLSSRRSKQTRKEIATQMGLSGSGRGDWGAKAGTIIHKGLRFTVQPQGFGVGRLQIHCPRCNTQISCGIYGNDMRHLRGCLAKCQGHKVKRKGKRLRSPWSTGSGEMRSGTWDTQMQTYPLLLLPGKLLSR